MIDPHLQAELREKFNPEGSDLRNMQLRMLEMLKYIDKVCRENNIKYWLSSGTCIGAVRHGGFIPWDDDCDIELEKSDYNKLVKILKNNKDTRFVLQDVSTDSHYIHPWAKLRDLDSIVIEKNNTDTWNRYKGCFIDIFCIEPSYSRKVWKLGGDIWYKCISLVLKLNSPKLRIRLIALMHIFLKNMLYPILRIPGLFYRNGKYRHHLGVRFLKERYRRDFKTTTSVKFEDSELPIPVNYDHYLRQMYGDYMQLPDISKIPFHFKSFKLNIDTKTERK